jgi:ketosteroid isomerase-like protein
MRLRHALLALAFAGCAPLPPRPAELLAEEPAAPGVPGLALAVALRGADAAFARSVSDRDEEAFRGFLAEEAIFVGARGLLQGRETVVARWRRFLDKDGPSLRWAPTGADGAASGDLGWTVGNARYEGKDAAGKPLVDDSRYLTVWARRPGGPWQVVMDMELSPAERAGPMHRSPVRTLTSRDGALEASVGTWSHSGVAGNRSGAFLTVRERSGTGWKVVHDSAVVLPE